jgi:hypothetical protein
LSAHPVVYVLRDTDISAVRRYFDEHVDRSGGEDACWPWGGMSYTRRGGYGYMVIQGKPARHVKAHRLALFFDGRDPGTLGALHSQGCAYLTASSNASSTATPQVRPA